MNHLMTSLGQMIKPIASVVVGLFAGLLFTYFAGENPWHVFQILVRSAFGSSYDFGMTLHFTTPLIFSGLSVAFAFHSGLFNIGAEGQLLMGAFAAAAVGACFPSIPFPLAPVVAIVAAIAAGGFWGMIPGWLRARRGSHEVINTIMLNFIAVGLTSWATLYLLPNPNSQNPETREIATSFHFPSLHIFNEAPVNIALILALFTALGVWFLLWKTVIGYEIRAVGQSETASRAAGIDSPWIRILAMTTAGALAGMVGLGEVLGDAGRFKMGFSPGYGFMGIAVALLGRNKPLGVVVGALLFGALHKGSLDLDLETENVTRDISLILQACVILAVSADGIWDLFGKSFRQKRTVLKGSRLDNVRRAEGV